MLTYSLTVLLMLITPGPGVLTTAGVGAGFGRRAGLIFLAGLWAGSNLVAILVISGLAALVLSAPGLRMVLLWASAAFFLWLAFKIAFSGVITSFERAAKAPGFTGGLMLQFINPKAYAVNNLFFSGYPFWPDQLYAEAAVKLLIMNAIWIPVHIAWLMAGVGMKRLNLSARAQNGVNIFMALSLLGAVALAAVTGV